MPRGGEPRTREGCRRDRGSAECCECQRRGYREEGYDCREEARLRRSVTVDEDRPTMDCVPEETAEIRTRCVAARESRRDPNTRARSYGAQDRRVVVSETRVTVVRAERRKRREKHLSRGSEARCSLGEPVEV